ncbi:MAG: hypothetical protein ACOC24_07050 [Desulfovibrionales bacterium]
MNSIQDVLLIFLLALPLVLLIIRANIRPMDRLRHLFSHPRDFCGESGMRTVMGDWNGVTVKLTMSSMPPRFFSLTYFKGIGVTPEGKGGGKGLRIRKRDMHQLLAGTGEQTKTTTWDELRAKVQTIYDHTGFDELLLKPDRIVLRVEDHRSRVFKRDRTRRWTRKTLELLTELTSTSSQVTPEKTLHPSPNVQTLERRRL